MKKGIALSLILLILVSLIGCGAGAGSAASGAAASPAATAAGEASAATEAPAAPAEKLNIAMAGGPPNAANYILLAGIGNIMAQEYDRYILSPEISNGSAENVRMIEQGTAQIGVCQSDSMYFAFLGEREFDASTKDRINFVTMGNEVAIQMVVPAGSEIQSMADITGKRCGVASGTALQAYWPMFLEEYGIDESTLTVSGLSMGDVCTGIADGTLDLGFLSGSMPNADIANLAMTSDVRFIPIEPEIIESITTQFPYFAPTNIAKDVYGNAEEVPSIGGRSGIIASPDTDEQFIYDFLDTLFTHREEIAMLGAAPAAYNVDNALIFSDLITMHPGAERYFKEHDMME